MSLAFDLLLDLCKRLHVCCCRHKRLVLASERVVYRSSDSSVLIHNGFGHLHDDYGSNIETNRYILKKCLNRVFGFKRRNFGKLHSNFIVIIFSFLMLLILRSSVIISCLNPSNYFQCTVYVLFIHLHLFCTQTRVKQLSGLAQRTDYPAYGITGPNPLHNQSYEPVRRIL